MIECQKRAEVYVMSGKECVTFKSERQAVERAERAKHREIGKAALRCHMSHHPFLTTLSFPSNLHNHT